MTHHDDGDAHDHECPPGCSPADQVCERPGGPPCDCPFFDAWQAASRERISLLLPGPAVWITDGAPPKPSLLDRAIALLEKNITGVPGYDECQCIECGGPWSRGLVHHRSDCAIVALIAEAKEEKARG